jgi:hypothetical protein
MEIKLIDDLVKDIESSDESTRVYAIEDLCEINDIKISAVLINRLRNEKSQIVREKIIDGLKKIISPEMYSEIYNMFDSEDAFTRNAATMIFATVGDAVVEYLSTSFVNSNNNEVKKLILDSLFEIGTPLARQAIRLGINDHNMNVMISSIEYLGALRDTESGNRFIEILKNASQPMLIITLLRSISKTCDSNLVTQAVEILIPGKNYNELNNLYLGEVLNLIGKGGNIAEILKILELDFDYSIYSEEISRLLLSSSKMYQDFTCYTVVKDTVYKILNNNNITNDSLLNIFQLFLHSKDTMISAGIDKLLAAEISEEKEIRFQLLDILNKERNGINN